MTLDQYILFKTPGFLIRFVFRDGCKFHIGLFPRRNGVAFVSGSSVDKILADL